MKKTAMGIALAIIFGCNGIAPAFDFANLDAGKVVSGGAKVVKAASGISDKDEIAIGEDVANNMKAKFGTVDDAKLTAYIDMVGQTLVKKCSRSNIPYHFMILKSPDINAFAAPGGFIFVTQGLLEFVKDEGELAGVLGHEISHVTQKHVVKAIQKSNLLAAGVDFASASGQNPELRAQLAKFTTDLLLKGLSRQDELEADSVGTVLMNKAGYTPLAMKDTMTRLGQMEGKSSVVDKMYQTHPPAKDRLVVINKAIASNHLATNGQRQKRRFEMSTAKA